MEIAELLKTTRRSAGLSQRALADRSGTSSAAICEYESGRRMPRVDTFERLIAATGMRLRVQIEGKGHQMVDLERNGRILASLFDFVDYVPRVRRGDLTERTLAREAR